MENKKIMRKSIESYFFQDFNGFGVFHIIFSFIKTNKDVLSFAYVNKQLYNVYKNMVEKSSSTLYQYKFLTNDTKRKDYTFNLFSKNLNENYYCTNIEEYESFDNLNPYLDNNEKEENLMNTINFKNVVWILEKINKKYGQVAMISGGKALELLTRVKDWHLHVNRRYLHSSLIYKKKHEKFFLNNPYVNPDSVTENLPLDDVDIFLLGKNKVKIAKEIICELEKRLSSSSVCNLKYKIGLIDVHIGDKKIDYLEFQKYTGPQYNGPFVKCYYIPKYFQIILKENAQTPNDIFCLFDLDCCKIGWFPGLKKVVVPIDFIRSIKTSINYAPLDMINLAKKQITRIVKYFNRTFIRTEIKHPPLLSYYHTFKDISFRKILKLQHRKYDRRLFYLYSPHKIKGDKNYFYMDKSSIMLDDKCNENEKHYSRVELKYWKKLSIEEQKTHPYYYSIFGWLKNKNNKYIYKRNYLIKG